MLKKIFAILLVLCVDSEADLCSNVKSENNCVCKRITDIDGNLPITLANCARTGLEAFPDQLQLRNDLNHLDLSHNQIQKLDSNINSSTLLTIQLSYNHIGVISVRFFQNVPNLRRLDLSHNVIGDLVDPSIFGNLKKLSHLDLSFNRLKKLPENILVPQVNLKFLDLSYNNEELGKWLSQSSDALDSSLGISRNITHLILNNLGIMELGHSYFDSYNSLKHLSVADNKLKNVPNVPYSVEYLDVSGSDIALLQAKHLSYHSLKVLKLNRLKKLESIHRYAFYNLQSLEDLSITNCYNLKEFNEEIFGLISKDTAELLPLKKLSLARNSLTNLNKTYQYLFDRMDFVDLSNNPWECDCNLLWFQQFKSFFHNIESTRCSMPRNLKHKLVIEVVEDDVPNCYPEKYGKRAHRILLPILLLLIIILAALIGYLIFYAPSWYGSRSRGVGPQSPYNPTRVEGD